MNKYILIGKVTSVHGIKGAVKIASFAEIPENIFNYQLFDKDGRVVNIKKIGILNSGLFISQINDINNRNDAEKLINLELFIDKSELKSLQDGEFYINELINMKVKSSSGLGRVTNVYNYGAGNVMEIKWENGKNTDIPFIEQYVKNVDTENQVIEVELPEYI